ncbi:MAG: hypothetical protein FDW93_06405 [Bergeyella sp.]|nr:hypothetical protein [Bergeyella sp.]
MKKGTLTNVETVEAGKIVQVLGGERLLYRDIPLLDESQINVVAEEFKGQNCDCILFDKGALFDRVAYDLAYACVNEIKSKDPERLKVVIFNTPEFPTP